MKKKKSQCFKEEKKNQNKRMPLKNEKKRKKGGKSGRNPKMYYSQENI